MSGNRDNSGTLGANKRKEKETHPSHTGQCVIDGTAYWISAWVKEGPTGRFFSLSFKPKDGGNAVAKPKPAQTKDDDFSDDIPFAWIFTGLFTALIFAASYAAGFSGYAA